MITVFPAAPSSPLVMAALATLTGAVPSVGWAQGNAAPATSALPAAAPVVGTPAVGAPVPLLPPALPQAAGHPAAQAPTITDRAPVMMTDTPEYCASLGGRVEDMARGVKASAEATTLVREGQRLCENGKTRVGVQHLRRAFIMLRETSAER